MFKRLEDDADVDAVGGGGRGGGGGGEDATSEFTKHKSLKKIYKYIYILII